MRAMVTKRFVCSTRLTSHTEIVSRIVHAAFGITLALASYAHLLALSHLWLCSAPQQSTNVNKCHLWQSTRGPLTSEEFQMHQQYLEL